MDAAKKGPSAARRMDTKKMAILAMMAALAYVVMLVGRVPIVLWLKYDPKDVVIAIAAFIYGPMAGVGISIRQLDLDTGESFRLTAARFSIRGEGQ